jgi:hypothetical protein
MGILQEEFQLRLIGASRNLLAPFLPSAHLQKLTRSVECKIILFNRFRLFNLRKRLDAGVVRKF